MTTYDLELALLPAAFLALAACTQRASPPAAAPPPHHEESDFAAPAGLKWGESPDEAKKALLADNLSFQGQVGSGDAGMNQVYQGTFSVSHVGVGDPLSAFAAASALAEFRDGKLSALVVVPAGDGRPASQVWQDMVDKMRHLGGEPTKLLSPFPKKAGADQYAVVDQKLKTGTSAPSATWVFKGALVTISINSSKLDPSGARVLHPAWGFFGPSATRR